MLLLLPILALSGLISAGILPGTTKSNFKDVKAISAWPKTNSLGSVENGKTDNLLWIKVINDEGEQITLTKLYGQFYSPHPTTKVESTRNTTIFGLNQPVLPHTKSRRMNYTFHSENPVGSTGLRVFIDFLDAGNKPHTIQVHDGQVNVIEPIKSFFDFPLLLLYAILTLAFFYVSRALLIYNGLLSSSSTPAKKSPTPMTAGSRSIVMSPEGKIGVLTSNEDGTSTFKESKGQGLSNLMKESSGSGPVSDEYLPNLPKAGKRVNKKERAANANATATSGEESEGAAKKGKKGKK